MNAVVPLLAAALALSAVPAAAQHGGHHQHGPHRSPPASADPARPHAGLQGGQIRSLSEEQVGDLLAGRGMGLAMAAELNGYPGPLHVLEHAEALRLTATQRATAEALRSRVAGEARILGARIVGLERELDALFAGGTADTGRLAALTAQIGALNGRLREVHLSAHIEMRQALSAEQRAAYERLRGHAAR
jgi:Spy/CpxP family protein refolding chaperone